MLIQDIKPRSMRMKRKPKLRLRGRTITIVSA